MALLVMLVALAVVVGLIGIVVPVLPGLLIVWLAVAGWAAASHVWWLAITATILYAVGLTLQYVLPGRRLKAAGVPTSSLVVGVVVAIVGGFVIPVIGALPGFVLGVFVGELARLKVARTAWAATTHAVRAVGLSMAIELSTGFLIAAAWVLALLLPTGS
ncbi:DUF456 family protein [Arsenicicoccus dermatophilus]|uniref:DUF456 family protein n=1 Tax=Arsenicicoccus dermatophilus TaxID=1076331 RepID=UPI001F4CC2B8|nr:DUF456 domain-containing protein [Arsenicicoccus dermatophilus]